MRKYGKAGHSHGIGHLTGRKGGKKKRRKRRRNGKPGLSRKQRRVKRGSHINKYNPSR